MRNLRLVALTSLTLPFCIAVACGGGDESKVVGGGGIGAAAGAGGNDASTGGGINLDSGTGGGAQQCGPTMPCETGVCSKGICCESAELSCNGTCCPSGDVCLFEQCKTPGKPCQSSADCGAGKYCETSLGDKNDGGSSDGGGATDGGPVCTSTVTNAGRCVDLPPICGDAGTAADGGTCFEKCEFFPTAGNLNTTKKWQWGQEVKPPEFPGSIDTWSTPTVGRIYDSNCDGTVNAGDAPAVVFVSGNAKATCCHCTGDAVSQCKTGVLRAVDGRTGITLWSLRRAEPSSVGFAAMSTALGDIDGDGSMEVVAMTGEGKLALISGDGKVLGLSDKPYPNPNPSTFGWGGGIALGDMDNDGNPEAAFGATVWTISGTTITHQFNGTAGSGGPVSQALSFFVDLDGNGSLELFASNSAYKKDGTLLWNRAAAGPLGAAIPNGLSAAADFDGDKKPEVVIVSGGKVWILEGATGADEIGPFTLPGTGSGGPPTVADFDGDGKAEIGVAQQNKYSMIKPNYTNNSLAVVWEAPNHDLSSSVTGSSVFDFEGDGKAEVIYNDECFLWVYDGTTGKVLLAELTTSFTGTEASIVADVDGDGHSEIVMVSNGADPSASGWKCNVAPWNTADAANNRPAWKPPTGQTAYRGLTVWGDKQNSWVGTRTLWNQHAYSVSNICDDRDSACTAPNTYGLIPTSQVANWTLPWLNNFRQNVQDKGLFDAPDAVVTVSVECSDPVIVHVTVRNVGLSGLPAGVPVDVYNGSNKIGSVVTTQPLGPGQSETIQFSVPAGSGGQNDTYSAKIAQDPNNKTFNECREDNNDAIGVKAECGPR